MDFESIEGSNLKNKMQQSLNTFRDELEILSNRLQIDELCPELVEVTSFNLNLKRIAQTICNHYNLSIDLIINDFEVELQRLIENFIDLPNINSYHLKFGFDEGSWIIFLRTELSKLISPYFYDLAQLDDRIWGNSEPELIDFINYLLMIDKLINHIIRPISSQWLEVHQNGDIYNFTFRIIASIYKITNTKSIEYYERLNQIIITKIEDLKIINNNKFNFAEIASARNLLITLTSDKQENSDNFNYYIICIAIWKKIISDNSLLEKKLSGFKIDPEYKILDKIGWNEYNLENRLQRENFIENILLFLYDRPEEYPIAAAQEYLRSVHRELHIPIKNSKMMLEQFVKKIEWETKLIDNNIEKEKKTVELIENYVVQDILKMKLEGVEEAMHLDPDRVSEEVISNNIEVQLTRVHRINDLQEAIQIYHNIIKSNYNLLISMNYSPLNAINFLLDTIETLCSINHKIIAKIVLICDKIIVESEKLSLSNLDHALIDTIWENTFSYIKN